jgi:hypothetical protein
MRIALLSVAVPWEARLTNGPYNIARARAIRAPAVPTAISSLATSLPSILGRLARTARREFARADLHEYEDVRIHTVRAEATCLKLIQDVAPLDPDQLGPLESDGRTTPSAHRRTRPGGSPERRARRGGVSRLDRSRNRPLSAGGPIASVGSC